MKLPPWKQGRSNRQGISLPDVVTMFFDDQGAENMPDAANYKLQYRLEDNVAASATVFGVQHPSYQVMANRNETVKHSAKQKSNRQAHVNGIETFVAMLKRSS